MEVPMNFYEPQSPLLLLRVSFFCLKVDIFNNRGGVCLTFVDSWKPEPKNQNCLLTEEFRYAKVCKKYSFLQTFYIFSEKKFMNRLQIVSSVLR